MTAPDPYRTISILPGQIWCDRQIVSRRVLILDVGPERVQYVSTYSAKPGLDGFNEELARLLTRGAPKSMKRSRWKSCFRFDSHPDATPDEQVTADAAGFPVGQHPRHPNTPDGA